MLTAEAIQPFHQDEIFISKDGSPRAQHIHLSPVVAAHLGAAALIILATIVGLIAISLFSFGKERKANDRTAIDREAWIFSLAKQRKAASRAVFASAALTVGTVYWLISALTPPTENLEHLLNRPSEKFPLADTTLYSSALRSLTAQITQADRELSRLGQQENEISLEAQFFLNTAQAATLSNAESPESDFTSSGLGSSSSEVVGIEQPDSNFGRAEYLGSILADTKARISSLREDRAMMDSRLQTLTDEAKSDRDQEISAYNAFLAAQNSRDTTLREFITKREETRAERDRVALWQSLLARSSTILVSLIFFAAALRQFLKIDRLHTENTQLLLAERASAEDIDIERVLALRAAMYISERRNKEQTVAAPENFVEFLRSFFGKMNPNERNKTN